MSSLLPSLALLTAASWQPQRTPPPSSSAVRAAAPLLRAAPTSARVTDLLELCAATDRGQRASPAERSRVAALVAELEEEAPPAKSVQLNGRWKLLYSSEPGIYRSSPFFWAFSQCTRGVSTPIPIPGSGVQQGDAWSAAVYAITDAIPFYDVGAVTQTISGVCDDELGCLVEGEEVADPDGPDDGAQTEEEPSEGTSDKQSFLASSVSQLVSEVGIEIKRLFGLPGMSSIMTTTATIERIGQGAVPSELELTLAVETTAARESTIVSLLPAFGELPTFPSGSTMELIKQGSSRVKYRVSYLTENFRISRYAVEKGNGEISDSAFFVYRRED
ncbi:hypothetical protein AB1Y20_005994 [Prymnesium parvum]|uniref:Plastid lipid-associated protein/fibrillin conserved domain-containing protein n=1 Tax=Prymnesium parvum TaxID=97485 RepID=A0AB34J3F1_PRYPA